FDFSSIAIVLPNKRARLFLLESFKKISNKTFFAPEIISIEDLITSISKVNVLTSIELLFEFYEVYKKITPKTEQQDFEQFSDWAKMVLQHVNEIDRYPLKPQHVVNYLKDIDDSNHWSVETADRSTLIENYIPFWDQLPVYYNHLPIHLAAKRTGYQGMAYR